MPAPPDGTPMVSVDYDPADLEISECMYCTWWWAEIVIVKPDRTQVLREWHEPRCPIVLQWDPALVSQPEARAQPSAQSQWTSRSTEPSDST